MKPVDIPNVLAATPYRVAAVVLAVTTTAAIAGALVLGFGSGSPEQWLTPTTEVLAQAQACDRLRARDARQHCKQQLVANALAARGQTTRLAGR